ncbi:hypothetical protein DL768_001846 [Monosporascus sp. mg162]|nr:hypothetical protein DL768_001846 [Monosporascus sp. mg162]
MMAGDREGKNCLHWAAQFGNAKSIEFILSKLSSKETRERFLALANSDRWTPLCWAVRPFEGGFAVGMRSAKTDFAGTVRTLLIYGADRTVKCWWAEQGASD